MIYALILLLVFTLSLPSTTWADHSTLRNDTFNTLPDSNTSTFRTNSQTFWDHEESQREGEHFTPFVYSGGTHPTSGSLTSSAFATVAYLPERVSQVATAITYVAIANDICWTIISSDNNGIAGWTRVGSTAYYYQCEGDTTPNEPSTPPNSALLVMVRVVASAINAVEPRLNHNPLSSVSRPFFNVMDYGATGDDTAIDTRAIIATIAAAPAGSIIYFPSRTTASATYRINDLLTISVNNITVQCAPGVTLRGVTLGTSTYGSFGASTTMWRINADGFKMEGCILRGPSVAAYVANEHAIESVGTSTSVRRSGLSITRTECYDFGSRCLATQFVDNIRVIDNSWHNIGYAAAEFLSSNHGWFLNNRIATITPGTGSNMYGVSLSHYSTGYNLDVNAGTKLATHPFSWGWVIAQNIIEDIAWTCIDAHGAYDTRVHHNQLYACQRGIGLTTGSGDAANYAGSDNQIDHNTVDAGTRNGGVSGRENLGYGIVANGGSTSLHIRITIDHNIVIKYGIVSSANVGCISSVLSTSLKALHNTCESWGGYGILFNAFTSTAEIVGNECRGLANGGDMNAKCLASESATAGLAIVRGNYLVTGGGTAARTGFDFALLTTRPILDGNDFTAATISQLVPPSNGFYRGSDYPSITASTDSAALSTTNCTPGLICTLQLSPTAGLTVTSITVPAVSTPEGMIIRVVVLTAQTVTFNVGAIGARTLGGAWSGNQYDSITLQRRGAEWWEVARSGDAS